MASPRPIRPRYPSGAGCPSRRCVPTWSGIRIATHRGSPECCGTAARHSRPSRLARLRPLLVEQLANAAGHRVEREGLRQKGAPLDGIAARLEELLAVARDEEHAHP